MNRAGNPDDYFPNYEKFESSTFQTVGARIEFAAVKPFTINREQASQVLDTLLEVEETFGPAQLGIVDVKSDRELVSRFRLDIFG